MRGIILVKHDCFETYTGKFLTNVLHLFAFYLRIELTNVLNMNVLLSIAKDRVVTYTMDFTNNYSYVDISI